MPWPPSSEQIDVVKKYLERAFPGFEVDMKYEDADMIHRFRLVQKSEIQYELVVDRIVFDDHSSDEIASIITLHGIAQKMRHAGGAVRISKYQGEVLIS